MEISIHWRHSGAFIVNFEHIPRFFSSVSIVDFEQVNVSWVITLAVKVILYETFPKKQVSSGILLCKPVTLYWIWLLIKMVSTASQLAFTFFKPTLEALEKSMKCVQS